MPLLRTYCCCDEMQSFDIKQQQEAPQQVSCLACQLN
jgi:hypothetical protein